MYDAAVGCLFALGAFGWIWIRGRLRRRFSPVCGVVDGSAAICSDSASADGDSLLKSAAGVLLAAVNSVELLVSADCSADGAGVLANGETRLRGDSNWFGRLRLKRDDGFNGAAVDGFSSLSNFTSATASGSVLPSADGAAVLAGVARDLPRKLKVGRVRNGRWVDVTCADVSMAFSSGFFSSVATGTGVDDRRLKRLRARMLIQVRWHVKMKLKRIETK